MFRLPKVSTAEQEITVDLEGESFTLILKRNKRNGNFFMDILKNEVPLIYGVHVLLNERSLRQYVLTDFTGGDISFSSLIPAGYPTLKSIEEGKQDLIYQTKDEVDALEANV